MVSPYHSPECDLVVIWGVRSSLSMIGLFALFVGFWIAENLWDEEGSKAFETARDNAPGGSDYKPAPDGEAVTNSLYPAIEVTVTRDMSQSIVRMGTTARETPVPDGPPVSMIPEFQLRAALPVPHIMIGGFVLWAISFLFNPGGGFVTEFSATSLFWFVFAIGAIVAFPLRKAALRRNLKLKKKCFRGLVLCWFGFMMAAILEKAAVAPWYYSAGGVLLIIGSFPAMWKYRKMGAAWDLHGVVNPKFVVQNFGGLMMIVGLFLVWIGTNALNRSFEYYTYLYLPIYETPRCLLACLSGLLIIVPSVLARDYAFDEGSKPVGEGYRLDGSNFIRITKNERLGKILESPLLCILGWLLFGICSFLHIGVSFEYSLQRWFSFLLCLFAGLVDALLAQQAFWQANAAAHYRWTRLFYIAKAFLAITIGIDGGVPLVLSVLGVVAIAAGEKWSLVDRKRGELWLQSRTVNPKATAFGPGLPTFMIGWILMCLAMSLPM
jgi:hypothetical protein